MAAQWDALYRLARLLAGADTTADDVLQAALLRAVRSHRAVLAADAPVAYLRRIVTTTAVDEAARAARRRREQRADGTDHAHDPTLDVDSRGELWPLVAALPPRQRAVVVLRFYEDLSEREIAAVLGCRPGTVKSQGAAAMAKLRQALAAAPVGKGESRDR
ncbi:sigma-70 family RNA polymerase sigma factor [Nocardioides sp. TF02-7]|nr:sigma-70 family RNA polymerase sigma factor [Nocardioides sp. TF02-7]